MWLYKLRNEDFCYTCDIHVLYLCALLCQCHAIFNLTRSQRDAHVREKHIMNDDMNKHELEFIIIYLLNHKLWLLCYEKVCVGRVGMHLCAECSRLSFLTLVPYLQIQIISSEFVFVSCRNYEALKSCVNKYILFCQTKNPLWGQWSATVLLNDSVCNATTSGQSQSTY